MIASHFVLADMERTLNSGNLAEAEKIFAKFARRYHADSKLKRVCREFSEYLLDNDPEKLGDVKKKVAELRASRKFESSGAGELPFKDRRHFTSSLKHDFEDY